MVNFLLSRNANPNLITKDGATPLHYALRWGNDRIIGILLDSAAENDVSDIFGRSPLHYAALRTSDIAATEQAMVGRCDVNKQDKYHMTPLHFACKTGNLEMVDLLLRQGAIIKVMKQIYNFEKSQFKIFFRSGICLEKLPKIMHMKVETEIL